MTHANRFFRQHPSDDQLDQWRAELYQDAPEMRDAIRVHVSTCRQCRGRADIWRDATTTLETMDSLGVINALRARRRQALTGGPAHHRVMPRLTHALAAAVAAVVIGAGAFFYFDTDTNDTTVATAPSEQPDIYVDIDFYLWLLQEQDSDDTGSSG